MTEPPETERREVVESRHGVEIRDPYRWLEEDTDEVAAWVDRQNEYADAHLDNDAREALEPRMEARAEVAEYGVVAPRERGYFQRVEAPDQDRATLQFRSTLDADPVVLADPNEWPEGESLDWFNPSPDGSLVAYGVAEGGRENYDVTVLESATGEPVDVLRDCGRTGPQGMAWTDEGFYYVATGSADEGAQLDKEIRYHELPDGERGDAADSAPTGADAADDPVLTADVGEHVWPQLETDDDGRLVVAYHQGWTDSEVFRWEGSVEDGELAPVITDAEASFRPRIRDGTLYITTDYDAPRSRIAACDADATDLDPDDLREIVPETDATLQGFAFAGDRLVVYRERDAHASLSVHGLDGERTSEVALPEYAAVQGLRGHPDAPEAFVGAEAFDRAPWVARIDPETGATAVVSERAAPDLPDLTVDQLFFESADGTQVPAFVVHRADLELDGDNPTVLYGYGGFRISLTPSFDRFRTPFLEDGGVYVQANLRGGSEYGEEWHRAGTRERKQNVFDDFLAVAEGLVDAGYTRPERLAAAGGSNGGLLVGAAITQRPELFGAAVCSVPLLDMLRFHEFLLGESWTTEYGSPDDPDAFEYLRAYSPYHNVEEREYPAVLFRTAAGDTRVHPGHARKMTARLQAADRGTNPILLRTETETGHGTGKPTSMRVREELDRWAFLYDRLGVADRHNG